MELRIKPYSVRYHDVRYNETFIKSDLYLWNPLCLAPPQCSLHFPVAVEWSRYISNQRLSEP